MKSEFMVSKDPFVYQDCVEFLDKVQNAGHAVCLLTGNMKAVARIKLEKFDLWRRFDFGVFAEDTKDKLAMPRLAKKRAWTVWQKTYRYDQMVVVGDTIQDAKAGIGNGCKTVIVCRKREKWDDINKMGPEWLGHCMDTIDLADLV
jgi:phosphoglycolate phosphatase-like HAD superfamily hydrolase